MIILLKFSDFLFELRRDVDQLVDIKESEMEDVDLNLNIPTNGRMKIRFFAIRLQYALNSHCAMRFDHLSSRAFHEWREFSHIHSLKNAFQTKNSQSNCSSRKGRKYPCELGSD